MPASDYQKTFNIVNQMLREGVFGEDQRALKLVETHISLLVLGSEFAWKFKKPVNFGFLDFSTLEKRHHCCQEELRLNSRFAKEIYLEVVSISELDGHYNFRGVGETIEFAVKMRRFDDSKLLGKLQTLKLINETIIDDLAKAVSTFHASADNKPRVDDYATPDNISHWFAENFDHIKPLLESDKQVLQIQAMQKWGQLQIRKLSTFMQARHDDGFVRECHGDLHLGNIVLLDDKVTLFDCIEFNPYLRWSDIVCDTAFLVMDLLNRGEDTLAFGFLNRYLEISGDYDGLTVLPYYLAYRALVRAKVAILRIPQSDETDKTIALREYQHYIDLASSFSEKKSPSIIITHGLSGSGKSTYAKSLANNFGAIRIRSDTERKRLAGIAELSHSQSGTAMGLYSDSKSEQTYEHLLKLSKTIIRAGFTVVVDATFLKASQRKPFFDLAKSENVDSLILVLTAPDQELEDRITNRMNENKDPSEATLAVLALQKNSIEVIEKSEADAIIHIDTCTTTASSNRFISLISEHLAKNKSAS